MSAMTKLSGSQGSRPLVILGAGYAGITVAHGVSRRSRGRMPILLVDRHPIHVLRTELYEVGRMVAGRDPDHWAVPLSEVLEGTGVEYRQGTVTSIDVKSRTVTTDAERIPFGALAIALGSTPAYYGVPGAAESTHQVYGLAGALRLADALRTVETRSPNLPAERRPRVVVIGGGSTGVELAAEIATTDWHRTTVPDARPPEVVLVTGALPFLAGLPGPLVRQARALLRSAGVAILHGTNSTRVTADRVVLEDGTVLAFDVAVWCAGVGAPPLVRALPVPHGKGGRVATSPTLEIPGHPGIYALGDIAEVTDARSGQPVPATAQAAVAEARVVAKNLMARAAGRSARPFVYRERGVILALGLHRGAAALGSVTVAGGWAGWLKGFVQREYARSVARGDPSGLL